MLLRCFIVISLAFLSESIPAKSISIDKALADKLVKADVTCKGGLRLNYCLKNLSSESLELVMPAGWRMNSVKDEYQDILVAHEQTLALKPHEQKAFEIKGYCCEASHSGPVKDLKYESGSLASPHLVLLAKYLNAQPMDENTEQYAVWAVSDNKPTAHINGANDSLAGLLRNFVSTLKGEPIPWYTLSKRVRVNNYGTINEQPLNLQATLSFQAGQTCYTYLYILDEKGNKTGLITGQWVQAGSNTQTVSVDLRSFKKGKYRMVLAGEKTEFINKEFEI